MRSWIVVVIGAVIVASVGADASPTRLVMADGTSATLVEADATAKIVATVKLPSSVQDLVWIGRDPIVLLEQGVVGAITAKGFVALATPPNSTFVVPRPGDGVDKLDPPIWGIVGSTAGELWLGRCDWGFHPDGGTVCTAWVWARLGGPTLLSSVAPTSGAPRWDGWPSIQPAPKVSVTFAKQPHRDDDQTPDSAETMTCRYAGTTTTFPDEPYYWTEHDTLRWVSRDPPMFVVDALANGFAGIDEPVVFEGCTPSAQFAAASQSMPPPIVMGPSHPAVAGYLGPTHLFVLATGQRSSLRRDGKALLALPGASFVAFAPDRLPAASDTFALLEREIAGDASMFASDAIVLSPTPAVGAPKLAKYATARIERFETATAGDSSWLAAELRLDGKPYRTLQLVDASGHVVVATFASVKSLASGGAAPRIPSPTALGAGQTPLADFAASPVEASKAAHNGTAVFGTELAEHAVGHDEYGPDLLAGWTKLALARDPAVREVHAAGYGYAIATVALAKSRMIALVIGKPSQTGWKLEAIHYLGL